MNRNFAYCPIEITLQVIGGKYKPIILFHLLKGPQRYKALQREIPGVSQRMLTLHLKELERDGLVQRTSFPEVPPRVEYAVTDFGRSLQLVLEAMNDWGKAQSTYPVDHHAPECSSLPGALAP